MNELHYTVPLKGGSHMTPARFQTIEQIYREALEQEPDQIGKFLNRACKGDAVLRHKVETLLN